MVTSFEVREAIRSAVQARDQILENAHFIDRELAEIDVPRAVKEPIWQWCSTFVQGWGEVSAYLDRIVESGRKYDRVHPEQLRPGIEEDISKVRSLVLPLMAGTRVMAEHTQQSAGEGSIVTILVLESTANIFKHGSDLHDALEKLLDTMKIDQADPYEGEQYPHWEFICANCGYPALVVTLIPADARHPMQTDRESVILRCNGVTHFLRKEDYEPILICLNDGNFGELSRYVEKPATLRCSKCKVFYCEDLCWTDVQHVFDSEGYYDYSTATCPNGHEQEIDD